MTEIDAKNLIGESPNEVFLRTGQFVTAASTIVYLGIGGFGIEMGEHSQLAPIVSLVAGIFMMLYGSYLRKNHLIAKQKHELRMIERRKKVRSAKKPEVK